MDYGARSLIWLIFLSCFTRGDCELGHWVGYALRVRVGSFI